MAIQQPNEVMNAAAPPRGYGPPGGGYGPPGGGGFGQPPGAPPGGGAFGPPGGGAFGPPPGGGAFGAPAPAAAPGGFGQPAPVPAGFGAAPGAISPDLQKQVDKWSMMAIVTFFFGCGVFALIPIMMANGAKDALRRGDAATAQSKIGTVKILCILGFVNIGFWLFLTLVYAVVIVFASM